MRLCQALLTIGIALALWAVLPGCPAAPDNGLKPGINYMRPMNWEITYHYRVQDIKPKVITSKKTPWALNPNVRVVGPGTYELWFTGPMEGGNVRNVEFVSSSLQPTAIKEDRKTGVTFYYFDLTPNNMLPAEIDLTLTWRMTTFELYTHWKGMPRTEYDKSSELYKKFTKQEPPITFSKGLQRVAKSCVAEDPTDYMHTALNCFNYMIQNFYYDYEQIYWMEAAGLQGLHDASITWDNKAGVCDEFATVYCAMLRSVGIPARTVAGLVHLQTSPEMIEDDQVRYVVQQVINRYGPVLKCGGHAWTEFYLPDVGWVPADPTWGVIDDIVTPNASYIGNLRNIKTVDYYFGKIDPYRLNLIRNWNQTLQPPPKTPNAALTQDWFVGYIKRDSGVDKYTRGWSGFEKSNFYYFRSTAATGVDNDIQIKLLGPAREADIKDIVAQFKEEGAHYLKVPPVQGMWPQPTAGVDDMMEKVETIANIIEEVTPPMSKASDRQEVMEAAIMYLFN